MKYEDPVVDQFVSTYGIRQLLDDVDAQKIIPMGQYFMISCLFHENNRTPDLQIHKKKGLFICFGCQAKGNLYQFVSKAYNISIQEAGQVIQKLAGFDATADVEALKFQAQVRNILAVDTLDEDDQLHERNWSPEIKALFDTGPDPYNYLPSRGFTPDTIAYFECTFTNKWRVWDDEKHQYRFEERVVIPGHLTNGNLKGYIGRTPVGDEPKYRYTAGYQKKFHLFNFHRAKEYVHNHGLTLVEGPLDAMQIHNLGNPAVASIYGANLSKEQIKLVSAFTDKIYLGFDNDEAGRRATVKAVEVLKDYLEIYILNWAPFKDPGEIQNDSTLKKIYESALNWNVFRLQQELYKGK